MNTRTCRACNETKPLEEFHKAKRGKFGRRGACKVCRNIDRRDREYGLKAGEWDQMYDDQNGRCRICNRPFGTQMVVVDHCHSTGRVRGLLHQNCNTKIGWVEWHKDAIFDYLDW